MNDKKLKCVLDYPPFVKDEEYVADGRTIKNVEVESDIRVLIIESEEEDGLENCYLVPLEIVHKHFITI